MPETSIVTPPDPDTVKLAIGSVLVTVMVFVAEPLTAKDVALAAASVTEDPAVVPVVLTVTDAALATVSVPKA